MIISVNFKSYTSGEINARTVEKCLTNFNFPSRKPITKLDLIRKILLLDIACFDNRPVERRDVFTGFILCEIF